MNMLDYLIRSQVVLFILYLFYVVLLHKKISFTFSRIYLLSIIPFSLALPLLDIPVKADSYGNFATYLPQVLVASPGGEKTLFSTGSLSGASWTELFLMLYLAGFLFCTVRMGLQFFRGWRLLRSVRAEEMDGTRILVASGSRSAFSLFGKIVIGECHLENPDVAQIIRHEALHVRFFHSADLLFVFFQENILWFNPIVWLLGRNLREIHEYQVDEAMLVSGADPYRYSVLLLNFEAEHTGLALANKFSYATLKNRIRMMAKRPVKTNVRLLLLLPVMLVLVLMFCVIPVGEAKPVMTGMVAESVFGRNPFQRAEEKGMSFAACPIKPRFQNGDQNTFTRWVFEQVTYPPEAKKNKVQGRVTLQFTVGQNGKVSNARVLRGADESLDKEALRVVSLSPDWEPGRDKNGNPIDVRITFPVIFSLR